MPELSEEEIERRSLLLKEWNRYTNKLRAEEERKIRLLMEKQVKFRRKFIKFINYILTKLRFQKWRVSLLKLIKLFVHLGPRCSHQPVV